MKPLARLAVVGCVASGLLAGRALAQVESPAASTLENQPLDTAIAQLTDDLGKQPGDDATRFALGIGQTLHAAERMAGTLYKFGLRDKGLGEELPFLRVPVPHNPDPQPVSAEDLDAMFAQFVADLATADKTLEGVKDADVKLPVHPGLIHLDLNGDAAGGEAPAWRVMFGMERMEHARENGFDAPGDPTTLPADDAESHAAQTAAEQFVIDFDAGDVKWLRGYVHLLSAMAEIIQTYDKRELIERTGQLFFDKVKGPHAEMLSGKPMYPMNDEIDYVDAVAFIHLLNLPVHDGAHMKAAREHLLTTLRLSRESWAAIRAETDDDHEWIPNEHQQNCVFAGAKLTPEIIDAWLKFLDDGEACLNGDKLLPFWRGKEGVGINLRKVFEQPQTFDLVLWIQGSGVTPFLESGKPIVGGENVRRLDQLLEGDFFNFAAWVN